MNQLIATSERFRLRFAVFRLYMAGFLRFYSLLLIISAVGMYLYMWWSAWRVDRIPIDWGVVPGNHGPWRFSRYLSLDGEMPCLADLWYVVFLLLAAAGVSGFLAVVLKPVLKSGVCFAAAVCLFFLFGATHIWLVD